MKLVGLSLEEQVDEVKSNKQIYEKWCYKLEDQRSLKWMTQSEIDQPLSETGETSNRHHRYLKAKQRVTDAETAKYNL